MTATADARIAFATQAAGPLSRRVQKLVDDGYLSSAEGNYTLLSDFSEEWAQLNWYQFWNVGLEVENFVLQANMHWESASNTADWWNSGCGFVFRLDQATEDHYLVYLGLDGYVNLTISRNNDVSIVANKYFGKVETPEGRASLMLVIDGERMKVFIDDTLALTAIDKRLQQGGLAYTLVSGTNKDYGTRCELYNVGLWQLK